MVLTVRIRHKLELWEARASHLQANREHLRTQARCVS